MAETIIIKTQEEHDEDERRELFFQIWLWKWLLPIALIFFGLLINQDIFVKVGGVWLAILILLLMRRKKRLFKKIKRGVMKHPFIYSAIILWLTYFLWATNYFPWEIKLEILRANKLQFAKPIGVVFIVFVIWKFFFEKKHHQERHGRHRDRRHRRRK
jgi:hypothetical protein